VWKYLFLTAEKSEGVLLPRLENGKELEGWEKGISLYEYANQLGEENWELVNLTWQGKEPLSLVFKKPMLKKNDKPTTLEPDATQIQIAAMEGADAADLLRDLRDIDVIDQE